MGAIHVLLLVSAALQRGDVAGEPQPDLPLALAGHAEAALSAADEARTLRVPAGFRVELVAAEPLIEAPVHAVFDEDGRLWVVEMRGYMRDVDATGENAPIGRVSVLHDDDGDGRMDRAIRFLDGLVLPRAVAPTLDGALVIAPPDLLFCRDTDGDGVADERRVVDSGLAGIVSPEYGPNGLLYTLDNGFRSVQHEVRYRHRGGQWIKDRTLFAGQWGVAEDEHGDVYYTTNSDLLRGDLIPSHEAARNPFLDADGLVNVGLAREQSVHPVRATTAVNRAYRPGWLKDGRIWKADAACGTYIESGGLFPPGYSGNAFVCEPAGNLVKRLVVADAAPFVRRALPAWDAREFLASTDERFRPVNLFGGPDGALYVVDLYRGLLQHRQFLTSFLRRQTLLRGLDQPLDRGRIWRVVPESAPPYAAVALSELGSVDLVPYLGHDNAWLRKTAQRLFVEGDWDEETVLPRLRTAAATGASARMRVHALWALEGRGVLDDETLLRALGDPEAQVRLQALRAGGERVPSADGALLAAFAACAREPDPVVARQAVAVLALARTSAADAVVAERVLALPGRRELRHAALLGAAARGMEVLERLLDALAARPAAEGGGDRAQVFGDLAACIVREGRADEITRLLELACSDRARDLRVGAALLEGALDGRGRGTRRTRVEREPAGLRALSARDGAPGARAAAALDAVLAWPGRTDLPLEEQYALLGNEDMARFERGRRVYATICAACHQPSGMGSPGIAPPLRDSPYLLGDPTRAAAIVIGGLRGPIEVHGRVWNLEMPGWAAPDDDIAAVLTYARREWGHAGSPVSPGQVQAARGFVQRLREPLTAADLERWVTPAVEAPEQEAARPATLEGWRAIGDALWSVEDGAIRGRVGGGAQSFLATERTYGDFVLEADVRCLGAGNSGIQVRSSQREDGRVVGCQIEIDPSPRAWSGGLYDEGRRGWLQDLAHDAAARAAFRAGEWNRFRIECSGVRIRSWINGVPIVDALDPLDVEGFIALQVHSGRDTDVLWRGLSIEDFGRRAWRPVEPLVPIEDGAVRLRLKGRRLVLRLRDQDAGVPAGERRTWPGVEADAHGIAVSTGRLEFPPGVDAEKGYELCVSVQGPRIAIHVDGRRILDAVGVPDTPGPVRITRFPEDCASAETLR